MNRKRKKKDGWEGGRGKEKKGEASKSISTNSVGMRRASQRQLSTAATSVKMIKKRSRLRGIALRTRTVRNTKLAVSLYVLPYDRQQL